MTHPTAVKVSGVPAVVERIIEDCGSAVLARRTVITPDAYVALLVLSSLPRSCFVPGLEVEWSESGDPDELLDVFELPYRPQPESMADDEQWRSGALDLASTALTSIGAEVILADPSDRMPMDGLEPHEVAGQPIGFVFFAIPDPRFESIAVVHVDAAGMVRMMPRKHDWEGPWPLVP